MLNVEQIGPILRLTLDDQPTRNSLSEAMMRALEANLNTASVNNDVAVIVVAAKGAAFSSGHNLKELTAHRANEDKGAAYFEQLFAQCSSLMMMINRHTCPVIAEVDGLASAAGCQLVASCDLAYASPQSSFCTPGVNIGLFCSTPMVALSRNVANKHAMEMLLTGDVKDAEFAKSIGLINAIVPTQNLTDHVMAVATKIASKSKAAITYGKRSYYDQQTLARGYAYALASGVMVKNMLDGAACEGLDAFINKRQAVWPE